MPISVHAVSWSPPGACSIPTSPHSDIELRLRLGLGLGLGIVLLRLRLGLGLGLGLGIVLLRLRLGLGLGLGINLSRNGDMSEWRSVPIDRPITMSESVDKYKE